MSAPFTLANPTQVKSQKPKGFPSQQVHHFGFLPVQFDAKKPELFLEPLQSPFGPTPFSMVSADSDDNIIGEPMIVDRLVVPFCRFAANRVEEPVDFVQVDVRRQRTERSPLRDTELAANLDNLLHEVHDLWVLDPLRDFVQKHRMPNRVEIARQINIDNSGHPPHYTASGFRQGAMR